MEVLPRRAVVLVVDRLGANHLGPYGNTLIETPQFNRLAFDSLLLENAITCSAQLAETYQSYWQPPSADANRHETSLPEKLAAAGIATTLLTDEPEIAQHPLAAQFEHLHRMDAATAAEPATELEQTELAQVTAATVDALGSLGEGSLLWVHAQGMAGPWDAPVVLRNALADEEDPDPPQTAQVPSLLLEEDADPDIALGWSQAYAGQVMLLDTCLGVLLDAVESLPDEWLLIVTSPRGFPLGEHGVIGAAENRLHGELLHTPWFILRSDGVGAGRRFLPLVHAADMYQTLASFLLAADEMPASETASQSVDLCLAETAGESTWPRNRVVVRNEAQVAIRTPGWFMRQVATDESDRGCQLYRKPDDRWEFNEVSALCTDAVELLREELDKPDTLPNSELPEILINGMD